jgi:hypothetical protein
MEAICLLKADGFSIFAIAVLPQKKCLTFWLNNSILARL